MPVFEYKVRVVYSAWEAKKQLDKQVNNGWTFMRMAKGFKGTHAYCMWLVFERKNPPGQEP